MVVWIASYPRSGNTFFRLVLNRVLGMSTYSVFDEAALMEDGAAAAIGHEDLPEPLSELAVRPESYLVKTHRIPDAASAYPAVYIVRDGRDSLVSCAHFQIRYGGTRLARAIRRRSPAGFRRRAFRRALSRMVHDTRFGGWSTNVTTWHGRDARTIVVRYENLVSDPVGTVTAALAGVGVSLNGPGGTIPAFDGLHARWPGMFRRGEPGAWRHEMPEDVQEAFWSRHGAAMRLLGYE